jgi:hypothetical protein
METKTKRQIDSGAEYDHLFPRANLTTRTEKRGATVKDTVKFIPKVVERTAWQTRDLAKQLRGDDLRDTCQNIWNFCYKHIRYHKDEDGLEQIRSPARAWHDRQRGVDCDCYTTLISTILMNLKIPHVLRITKYKQDHFQHIYPIVPTDSGDYITVDCVVDKFDKEEPYSEKQDTKMDLQYLDGLAEENLSLDQSIAGEMDIEGLGRFKLPNFNDVKNEVNDLKKMNGKDLLKKGLFITNRVNPATVTLRNGLLAALKINMFKLGSMLRWGYMTEADAQKRGVNMDNWKKLKKVIDKLQEIFYTAGGKPENLKRAILHGRGNRDHQVAGLGFVPDEDAHLLDEKMPLKKVMGEEMWHSENVEGMEDFQGTEDVEGLGEPYTAASIAAATGVLGAIAALIKNIGSVLPKKDKAAKDFEPEKTGTGTDTGTPDVTHEEDHSNLPDVTKKEKLPSKHSKGSQTPANNTDVGDGTGGDGKPPTFWVKNKKWLKPALFVAGGLALVGGGLEYAHHKKKEEEAKKKKNTSSEEKPVSGPPKRGRKGKPGRPKGSRNKKKQVKTLM